ncbi:MAG: hypothetical protein ACHQJ6_04080, partial [Candidatus Berkiellales bacterium]
RPTESKNYQSLKKVRSALSEFYDPTVVALQNAEVFLPCLKKEALLQPSVSTTSRQPSVSTTSPLLSVSTTSQQPSVSTTSRQPSTSILPLASTQVPRSTLGAPQHPSSPSLVGTPILPSYSSRREQGKTSSLPEIQKKESTSEESKTDTEKHKKESKV